VDPTTKVSTVVWRPPALNKKMTLSKIVECFTHGYRELPVVENKKAIGILSYEFVLKFLIDNKKIPRIKVADILSTPLVPIGEKESIAKALATMRKSKIHHLAVVDDNNKFVGVVSIADILPLLSKTKIHPPHGKEILSAASIGLRSILSDVVHSIDQNALLTEAADKLIKEKGMILVAFNDGPLGFIHVVDILRSVLPKTEPEIKIVGLDKEDRFYINDIKVECLGLIRKVERMMPVKWAKLTVKKYKKGGERHKYSLKFILTGKKTIAVDAFDWDLFTALHYIIKEVDKIVINEKEKDKGKKARRGSKRKYAAQLRGGEIYIGKPIP